MHLCCILFFNRQNNPMHLESFLVTQRMEGLKLLLALFVGVAALFAQSAEARIGTFWTVTDVHLAGNYKEGTDPHTFCTEGTGAAGKYGYFDCNTPRETLFQPALKYMADKGADFVLWMGDSPTAYGLEPHGKMTDEVVWRDIGRVVDDLTEAFTKRGIPVYPVYGNHEHSSAKHCPNPKDKDFEGFFGNFSKLWSRWLPEDCLETVRKGGYYTTLVAPKIRMLVFNSVYYWPWNVKTYVHIDPVGQFPWMRATLAAARAAGEKVLVVSHIPPVFDIFVDQWRKTPRDVYAGILDEYQDIVIGTLYGHDHTNSMGLLAPSHNQTHIVAVSQAIPSMTPDMAVLPNKPSHVGRGGKNPTFRLYEFDTEQGVLTDYVQYWANLTEVNANDKLVWRELYRMTEEYGIKDLSKDELVKSIYKIRDDKATWCKFLRHWTTEHEFKYGEGKSVRRDLMCSLLYTKYEKMTECVIKPPFKDFACSNYKY